MSVYRKPKLYIAGEWVERDGAPVINPADESVIGTVPHATREDLDRAIEAAAAGFGIWRDTAPSTRSRILRRAADLCRERADDMARTITLEQGKPLAQAKVEILRGADMIEWDATEGQRLYGQVIQGEPGMQQITHRQPVGVVAAFTPWNFPMSSPARKIASALAAGCSIIITASEETPGGAVDLVQAFIDAGVPAYVLNLVFGDPAQISRHLIEHDDVRMVTLTGSVAVGKQLAALCGSLMKPSVMELGGHAPVLVCEDADPVKAALACVVGKMRNSGQVCTSPTRFFVHERGYTQFVETFSEAASKLVVGDGMEPGSNMGPLANIRRLEAVDALVKDAVSKGASLRTGGQRIGNRGYFYPMTILADVPDTARAMQEEPFGPVALISPVRSLDGAISRANALPLGLAAYAFTNSTSAVHQMTRQLEAGNIAVNHFAATIAETPFGGIRDSGFGREGGPGGLNDFTILKTVSNLVNAA